MGKTKDGEFLWECKCDCGATKITRGTTLRNGGIVSCGCALILISKFLGLNLVSYISIAFTAASLLLFFNVNIASISCILLIKNVDKVLFGFAFTFNSLNL